MQKRILYLTSPDADYLSDSIFHGLRHHLGTAVVDFPKATRMYKSAARELIEARRGFGFTLYGTLDDLIVERPATISASDVAEFDLVVVADIWRQVEIFSNIRNALNEDNAIILDGADTPSLYKYAGSFWRDAKLRRVPGIGEIPYFKRELMPETLVYRSWMLLPRRLAARFMRFVPYKRTAFAVPQEKIVSVLPIKDKLMGSHIVDPEVAAHFVGARTQYAFTTEDAYYEDLRRSRFAVTTKRGGWDCLRHYEIAANACVPCFRNLQDKSKYCAPHGLDESNCISYTDLSDLLNQIDGMKEGKYEMLQQGALAWAKSNTTFVRATEMLIQSQHSDFLLQNQTRQLLSAFAP